MQCSGRDGSLHVVCRLQMPRDGSLLSLQLYARPAEAQVALQPLYPWQLLQAFVSIHL